MVTTLTTPTKETLGAQSASGAPSSVSSGTNDASTSSGKGTTASQKNPEGDNAKMHETEVNKIKVQVNKIFLADGQRGGSSAKFDPLTRAHEQQTQQYKAIKTAENQAAEARRVDRQEYGDDDDLLELFELMGGHRPPGNATPPNAKPKSSHHHEGPRAEVEEKLVEAEAARAEERAKLSPEERVKFDALHPEPVKTKAKLKLGGLKMAGGIAVGYVGIKILNEAFEAYMKRRVVDLMTHSKESRFDSLMGIMKEAIGDVPGTAIDFAKNLIPFYTSYQEYQKGNFAAAAGFALLDGTFALASVLSFGAATIPLEGLVYAAKVATNGAKIGALGYFGYLGLNLLKEFENFIGTKEGQLALKDAQKEAFDPNGMSRKDAVELALAAQADAADKIRQEKANWASSGRNMKNNPDMVPPVVAGNNPAPSGKKPDIETPVA